MVIIIGDNKCYATKKKEKKRKQSNGSSMAVGKEELLVSRSNLLGAPSGAQHHIVWHQLASIDFKTTECLKDHK